MLRILHTGDLHIGKGYAVKQPGAARRYGSARLEALENITRVADERSCDYIVIAGDTFDKHTVSAQLIGSVCSILARSPCPVVIIPGNHDYCDGADDALWNSFGKYRPENTVVLNTARVFETEDAVFYPCPCQDKHSRANALGWLREYTSRSGDKLNIGIAHGAIEGLSYDSEMRYYFMTISELESLGMDLWLIGHTHIPYPAGDTIRDRRIFNAGTHQQTDISDNSDGSVFVIDVDDHGSVTAERVRTGVIRFVRRDVEVRHGERLRTALTNAVSGLDAANTSLRITIKGTALYDDYSDRQNIYEKTLPDFLSLDVFDDELRCEITGDMIDSETVEGTCENRLLKMYLSDPELLNLAYELVSRCREADG